MRAPAALCDRLSRAVGDDLVDRVVVRDESVSDELRADVAASYAAAREHLRLARDCWYRSDYHAGSEAGWRALVAMVEQLVLACEARAWARYLRTFTRAK